MAKPTSLTPDVLTVVPAPSAATSARGAAAKPELKAVVTAPLQLKLPRHEIKAIKIAAAEAEQSLSDYMLACFHARMRK